LPRLRKGDEASVLWRAIGFAVLILVRRTRGAGDGAIQPGQKNRQQQDAEEEKAKVHASGNGAVLTEVPLTAEERGIGGAHSVSLRLLNQRSG